MSGVRNMAVGITSLNRLRGAIKELPLRIRSSVAKDAEAVLTRRVQEAFDGGETVYGTPRPTSKSKERPGAFLTLKKTNKVRSTLAFVAIGTIVRAQLGMKYAKYLVGKYAVLPQSLPALWRADLEQLVREHVEDFQREALR